MGLFRRKDERAIPKPGSKEFEEAVGGTPVDLPPDEPEPVLEKHEETVEEAEPATEPDEQTRGKKVLGSLGRSILKPPNAEGFGGGIPGPQKKRRRES